MRAERDLTQEAVAALAGVHQTYLSDIERSRRNVSIAVLHRLAAGLRVEVSELFKKC